MKERGILFSAPMVRALLAGSKTQTRRALKVQPLGEATGSRLFRDKAMTQPVFVATWAEPSADGSTCCICPYGVHGDRLWVRETWQGPLLEEFETDADSEWMSPSRIHQYQNPAHCQYAADGGPAPEFMDADNNLQRRWCPGIHMFRWASRITLEITEVRVERLQAISQEDAALREGIEQVDTLNGVPLWHCYGREPSNTVSPVYSYETLWESINGAGSWAANPWVWAVSFRRLP